MSVSTSAISSEPALIGSILFGADELVGAMVKARISHMRGRDWNGGYRALGVVRRGVLLGGVVYHDYRTFDIMFSGAFDRVGWALPGTLRSLFAYPFLDLDVRRMTACTGRKNKKARKTLEGLGFRLEGVCRRGLDGFDDACIYGMLKENCKWLRTDDAKRTDAATGP